MFIGANKCRSTLWTCFNRYINARATHGEVNVTLSPHQPFVYIIIYKVRRYCYEQYLRKLIYLAPSPGIRIAVKRIARALWLYSLSWLNIIKSQLYNYDDYEYNAIALQLHSRNSVSHESEMDINLRFAENVAVNRRKSGSHRSDAGLHCNTLCWRRKEAAARAGPPRSRVSRETNERLKRRFSFPPAPGRYRRSRVIPRESRRARACRSVAILRYSPFRSDIINFPIYAKSVFCLPSSFPLRTILFRFESHLSRVIPAATICPYLDRETSYTRAKASIRKYFPRAWRQTWANVPDMLFFLEAWVTNLSCRNGRR